MAAALRTPSLKYRSFSNEPVRNLAPPPEPAEDPAFSILGDALAGVSDLPADRVLGNDVSFPYEAPGEAADERVSGTPLQGAAPYPASAGQLEAAEPPGHFHLSQPAAAERAHRPSPPATAPVSAVVPPFRPAGPGWAFPVAPAAPPVAVMPAPISAAPAAAAVRHEASGSSLLHVLLGSPPVPAPQMAAASAVMPRGATRPAVVPSLLQTASGWPPARPRGSTGSTLLDTLVGAAPETEGVHFPLLDALGDAMRGTAAEPSPRHWPAARVDMALPELLRRVAAGVRFARTAA